jgi:hypothetical protein
MPMNTKNDVVLTLLVACADDTLCGKLSSSTLIGRGLYVANSEITDVEVPLHELQSDWLGKENSRLFDEGRQRLAKGMGLQVEHYLSS